MTNKVANIQLTEIIAEFSEAEKAFAKKAEKALKAAFSDFFQAFPEVEALSWPQYAPYFNDGSPCEFSVNEIREVTVNGETFDDYEYSDAADKALSKEAIDTIAELSGLITTDVLEDVLAFTFGRDCMVTATPKGFTTSEYDHD